MKTFLVTLGNKKKGKLTEDLLHRHIDHLKHLKQNGSLLMCGPFVDESGAMMIFRCHSSNKVKTLVSKDPFIVEQYYGTYNVAEFLDANEENNWLLDAPQTKGNL
ncbi:YciI family protein [Pseudalkalibacillus sp. A8]|uniref:YciI family protein n=1 Tax=Pseudalkalibacillus sp. A8 TaxID=3382641 RepID=UPI0038B5BE5B